jgi:hypothetical protein
MFDMIIRVTKPDFSVIKANSLTIALHGDPNRAASFQQNCPAVTLRGRFSVVAPLRARFGRVTLGVSASEDKQPFLSTGMVHWDSSN